MAELYQNNPETYHIDNSNGYSVPKYTGDKATDMQLNGLSDEDRKRYLEEANAPLTGEDVAKLVSRARETGYEPTAEEVQLYKQWAAKQNHSILQGIADGFAGVKNTFLNAGQEFIDHPFDTTIKLPTSVAEGFFQGGRNLYGMLAESQDPNSALFRFKSILTGDGSDPEAERRQFIEAMKFNHHTMDLEEGKDTLVLDKDIINHKVATAASFIADPTLLIPVVGEYTGLAKVASNGMRAIGLGERIAKITARSAEFQNKILGGALKWGVGTPVEFIGGAVRNTIDYGTMQSGKLVEAATGLPMSDWRATVRMSQLGTLGAEALGASIPVAGDISKAHLAGTFGQGLGSAISAVGDQMIKQAEFGRGINSYAKQALLDAEKNGIVLTQHTKNMLRVLDAVDPLFSYSRVMTEGAIHGAAVGGTLGALSGGEEGFAQGIGAGIGLGMVGAGGARLYGDIGSGTHNSRVDIQSKLTMEGWKQTQPEKSFFWGLVKAHAEATGNAEYINKVNGYIAGIDKVCPDLQFHSFTDGKSFNSWLIENGYNPETRHFIETTALMEKAGLTREEKAKVMSVLRDNGNKFAGDSAAFQEHMAGAGKDLKYKSTYDSLSSNAKDALHQTIDNHAELIKQLKGEGDTIKDFYGDHAAADKFVDNINQFHKNSPTDAIRKAKEVLDAHRDENGNLTRRGEYLKDKLRAEGYTDAEGNVLPQRNMAVADLSGAEFNAAAGFVCRREQDGKVHMYLNLENVTRKTIPHEVFHAIFRESPMKKEFMSRWMRELLGSRDAQGNITQKPSVDIEQVRKFFHRYADIDPSVIDKQAKKDSINKAIEEHQKSGTNNTIADGTQSSLEKYAEEFGAYYFSHWLDSKPTDYLFHGGELTGMRGLMERVKDGWTGYWKEKMGNANPDFNFDNKGSLESQFEKKGKRIEVDAFDLFMRDFTRATANLNRGAFDPRSMSSRALGDFADSNGIYNVSSRDTQGRTIAINENQYNKLNAIAGREIFKVLNGLDPKLRTTQTITIDGKQFIKGRFSQAELDAIVKSGHRNRAWADKHQQLYAVLDGKGSNVIDFGYLGRTAQIGDYSWPRLTGKQVPFKNRRAILLGMDSHIGQDGSFHTVFHTLDKAVIDARGNDVWKNPEARRLWNNDRAAMESDFFDYLANASLPKDHPDRKPSARLLEKMDGQGTPDGLGSQRRDWLHQMLGFAKDDRDVYINRPIAEIPFGIRHSVTSFNIDGATTFRVENGSRYNVNMDNAHNDLSRNFSPRDMEVEATPNGQIVKHKTGYRILENQRGNYNLISPTGEFISQHSTVADAGRSAQKHYDAAFDKSVEGKDLPVPRTEIPPARQAYIDREFGGVTDNVAGGKEKFLENLNVLIDRITESGDILIGKENRDSALRIKKSIEERGNVTLSELKEIQRVEGVNRVHDTSRLPYYNYDYFLETIDNIIGRNLDRLGKQYDNMYPMEIKSALHGRLSQIFQDYPNITAQGLLKKLETYGSTGYRYLQEARDIGLVDLLKKKIQPRTEIYRKLDAQGNPTGEVVQRELPVKFKQLAIEVKGEDGKPVLDKDGYPVKKLVETNKVVSGTQPKLDMQEILDFAKSKEIRVTIEEGAREKHGMDTERLTLGGDKSNYKETAIRINPEYAHGIEGHYGNDVIVHFRTTERLDAEGNRVLFVEEVQANNPYTKKPEQNPALSNYERRASEIEYAKKLRDELISRGLFILDSDGTYKTSKDLLVNDYDYRTKVLKAISNITGSGNRDTHNADRIIFNEIEEAVSTTALTYSRDDIIGRLDDVFSDEDTFDLWRKLKNNKDVLAWVDAAAEINKKMSDFRSEMSDYYDKSGLEYSHIEYPENLISIIADRESRLAQMQKPIETKKPSFPLVEIKDWSLTALKGIIRQAIRDGHDTITLTHPDDSPTVSHMEENARRKDYGEIFPAVWGSFLKKYGIEISRQNRLANPRIETLRNNLVEVQNKIPEANKKVMDRFQQVMTGEDPAEIKKVSELLSLPVHEADGRIADRIKIAALGINDVELKGLVEEVGLLKGAEKDAYKKIEQLRENGIRSELLTTEDIKNNVRQSGAKAVSAEAIDRGMTFKLNDAIKRDFTEGRIQIYAQPAEEGASISGGRKYDLNSPEFRTGFIGKVASTNQSLIKDKNLEFVKRKDGSYRITMTDNSGETQKVGHITATIDDSSMVAGEGVAEISSNIDPKFRGQKLANVLYSEMAERLRAMGIKYVDGTIVNKEGIPVQVRNTVIGQTYYKGNNKPAFRDEAAKKIQALQSVYPSKGVGVYNELDPKGYYSPNEGERTYSQDQFSSANEDTKKALISRIKSVPHLQKAYEEGQKPSAERRQNYLTVDQFKQEEYRKFHFLSHGPDTASTTDWHDPISGELLHKGQGGANYPALFPDKTWASTEGMGGQLANDINAVADRNFEEHGQRIAPVALIKSAPWKMRGTVNGGSGYVNVVDKLSERGVLTRKQLKQAIGDALNSDALKKLNVNKKVLGIDFNSSSETAVIDAFKKVIADPKMSLKLRKVYIEKLNAEVFSYIKDKLSKAEETIPTLKGQNITTGEGFGNALFKLFEDPMTQHAKEGEVYMHLLVRDNVEPSSSSEHSSYADSIKTVNGEPIQQDWHSKPIDPKRLFEKRLGAVDESGKENYVNLRPDVNSSWMLNTGQTQKPYIRTKAFQPAEGATDWKSERTTAGSILTNTAGYIISNINGKYKVYNPYKVMIGIYDNQEQAKKRVIREFSKQ